MTQLLNISAPVLVFGGPYSNLRALNAMHARAAELGIDSTRTICTGDVVAYCAEPEQTVAAIRDWGCHVVAGNCEKQLAQDAGDCGCGFAENTACDRLAKDWYAFARRRITSESRTWMDGLPHHLEFELAGRTVRVIHGGVARINRFVFASERQTIAAELENARAGIVVAGHAGLPFIERINHRVWFNPGVIGMPANDGTPDVWYGLIKIDGSDLVLSTHRLTYDHASAATATQNASHADGYARALSTGLWPSLDILPAIERAQTGQTIPEQCLRIAIVTTPMSGTEPHVQRADDQHSPYRLP